MLKYMTDNFPGCFSGYDLMITDSHQANKADVSGTAKAVLESFKALGAGADFDIVLFLNHKFQILICCIIVTYKNDQRS